MIKLSELSEFGYTLQTCHGVIYINIVRKKYIHKYKKPSNIRIY